MRLLSLVGLSASALSLSPPPLRLLSVALTEACSTLRPDADGGLAGRDRGRVRRGRRASRRRARRATTAPRSPRRASTPSTSAAASAGTTGTRSRRRGAARRRRRDANARAAPLRGVGGAPARDERASARWHASRGSRQRDAPATLGGCARKGAGARGARRRASLIAAARAGAPAGLVKLGGLYERGESGYRRDARGRRAVRARRVAGSALGLFNRRWAPARHGAPRDVDGRRRGRAACARARRRRGGGGTTCTRPSATCART